MDKLLFSRSLWRGINITSSLIALIVLAVILPACGGGSQGEIAVGSPAPAFSLPTADGGSVALSDYAGDKPVLLYFHMALG